jgi:glyoxylase I family protein
VASPLIQALGHIALSVANLDRSIAFYRDLLGMELIGREAFGSALYDRILRLENAKGEVALLRSETFQLEIFQFTSPTPERSVLERPVSELGITHFCIEVRDIHAAYDRLRTAGVVFHCEPIAFGGIVNATYARDPDGNVIELTERIAHVRPTVE